MNMTVINSFVESVQPMILLFNISAPGETLELPILNQIPGTSLDAPINGYDFTVDWGDGSSDDITAYNQAERIHTYAAAGQYTVTISGKCGCLYFNYGDAALQLLELQQWGNVEADTMFMMFSGCENMTVTATDHPVWPPDGMGEAGWDVYKTAYLFESCLSMTTCGAASWDVSSWTGAVGIFWYCESFNEDISGWDVSNCVDMWGLFQGCELFNADIGGWDVSSNKEFGNMFFGASAFDQDIGGWDVSQSLSFRSMFANFQLNPNPTTLFNQDITGWDTSSCIDFTGMFASSGTFDQDISLWNYDAIPADPDIYEGVDRMLRFAAGFSTANYDKLLVKMAGMTPILYAQDWRDTVPQYTIATALAERNILTNATNRWQITDGGGIGDSVDAKRIEAASAGEYYQKAKFWDTDGTKVTFAAFCRIPTLNVGHDGFIIPTSSRGLIVRFNDWNNSWGVADNSIDLVAVSAGSNGYYGISKGKTVHSVQLGDWFAIMGSVDYSAVGVPPTVQLWIHRKGDATAVDIKADTPNINVNGPITMDFNYVTGGVVLRVGASPQGNVNFDLCELFIDGPNTAVDWSNPAERAKYVTSEGRPVGLGATGSDLTGSQPKIYCPDGDLTNNLGSEPDFTVSGTISTIAGP